MVKITTRKNSDKLQLLYYIQGKRKRKSTGLDDTPQNRQYLENVLIPQLSAKISRGDIYAKKDISFKAYGDYFLAEKEKTTKVFLTKLSRYIKVIDHFGKKDVTDITRFEIKQYLASLDMKSKSKRIYKSTIKEILELAVDDNVIINNPATAIVLASDTKDNVDYFTKDDVNKLLSVSSGLMKVYLQIAFNTGMRPEEILGLQFKDITKTHIIISRVRTKGRIDTPKTKNSFRKVPFPSYLYDEIISLQTPKSLFLFGDINDAGRLRHKWARVVKDSGVDYKKLYSTRHTFATLMLKEKVVSINELAGLLGHSSPKVTFNHYASVIDADNINLDKDFSLFEPSFDTLLTHSN